MSAPRSKILRGTSSRTRLALSEERARVEELARSEGEAARREVALNQLAYEQEQLSKGVESVRDVMQNIFWAFGVLRRKG